MYFLYITYCIAHNYTRFGDLSFLYLIDLLTLSGVANHVLMHLQRQNVTRSVLLNTRPKVPEVPF